jgi:hypothetical protein
MIYFVKCASRVKIGFSEKPKLRVVKIATDSPFPCRIMGVMEGTLLDEADIHRKFSHLRTRGEWFELSEDLIEFITTNATHETVAEFKPRSKLETYLRTKKLTDEAFGALVGLSQSQVSRIKRGKSVPSWSTITAIEEATRGKVTIRDLRPEQQEAAAS